MAMASYIKVKLPVQRTELLLRNSPEPYPPAPLYPIASEGRLAIPPRVASYAVVALATEAKKHGVSWRRRVGVTILVCGLLIGLQGCSSTKNSSDIPWNVPQPWEGAPSIPGNQ